MKILFVCLGNICRSPMAEIYFRRLLEQRGLAHKIYVDSAGTGTWHVGEPADRRAVNLLRRYGLDGTAHRARAVHAEDFQEYQYLIAMDADVLDTLKNRAPSDAQDKISLFTDYTDSALRGVPDPYYGGPDGFEETFQIICECAHGFLDHLLSTHKDFS
jgi:protein-tyrosine phosphatase